MINIFYTLTALLFLQFWIRVHGDDRWLRILNRSGGPVQVRQIDDDERVLVKSLEDLANGTSKHLLVKVGHIFEVVQIDSDERKAVLKVNETVGISTVVTIDEEFRVKFAPFREIHQKQHDAFKAIYPEETLRLNSDFSLLPEINSFPGDDLPYEERLRYQWRRYRTKPISGVIENKILGRDILSVLDIPTAKIYYAAFAHKAMGNWPKYDRDSFLQAMRNTPEIAKDHHFVIKNPTGYGTNGVLIVNKEKWERQQWYIEELVDLVEWEMELQHSDDLFRYKNEHLYLNMEVGVRYVHRGILVLQSVLPQEANVEFREAAFTNLVSDSSRVPVFELKTNVVFGKLCWAQIHTVPIQYDAFVDISFCDGGEPKFLFASGKNGADRSVWFATRQVIVQNAKRLEETAAKITNTYGIDMFRLDVFMDGDGMFLVNELTYGSLMDSKFDCAGVRIVDAYRMGKFDVLNATVVLESLLQSINVNYDDFMDAPDYRTRTEEDYDLHGPLGNGWMPEVVGTESHPAFENTGIWDVAEDGESTSTCRSTESAS